MPYQEVEHDAAAAVAHARRAAIGTALASDRATAQRQPVSPRATSPGRALPQARRNALEPRHFRLESIRITVNEESGPWLQAAPA